MLKTIDDGLMGCEKEVFFTRGICACAHLTQISSKRMIFACAKNVCRNEVVMRKRIVALILAGALALQMLPLPAGCLAGIFDIVRISEAAETLSGTIGENQEFNWTLTPEDAQSGWNGDGTAYQLTLTGTGDMPDFNKVQHTNAIGNTFSTTSAPWWESMEQIQTISLGDGITNIPNYAFYNGHNVLSVEIPDSVADIGENSFLFCSSLKELVLPQGVKSIGKGAFSQCSSLTQFQVPKDITVIAESVFNDCSALEQVVLPNGLTAIDKGAFSSCYSLTEINLPQGLESIGNSAFYYCTDMTEITLPQGLKAIGSYAFNYCTDLGAITIPESVTSIGNSAFSSCSSLKEITVPASVKKIEGYTFNNCKQLQKAVICEGVESIGTSSFADNESLTEITLPQKSLKEIGTYAFRATSLTSFHIPASVTMIGVNPFIISSLRELTVEQGNQNYEAIKGLLVEKKDSSLSKVISYPSMGNADVTVPEPVQVIGVQAFFSTNVKSVDLPGTLLTIESSAFQGAVCLTAIDVPGLVTAIGTYAFADCSALEDVKLGGDILSIEDGAFSNCSMISEIILPDKITTIGNSVFNGCKGLKEITFPNSITKIGASVLAYCTFLEKVSFGERIKEISGNVFLCCVRLEEITISPGNSYMTAIDNVIYTKDVTKLIYYAAGYKNDRFMIPDTVQVIGSEAFNYCKYLEEIRFPESVTSLEENAFHYNESIDKLLFYGNAPAVTEDGYCDGRSDYPATSCYAYNTSVTANKVGNTSYEDNGYNNDGLVIFKTAESTGWEDGWTGTKKYKSHESHAAYKWDVKYLVTDWDPYRTDIASGAFGDLEWNYRDDIGEIKFTGEGKVPDFTLDNLPKWSFDDSVDHRNDVKLIDTGDAVEIGNNAFFGSEKLLRILTGKKLERIGECAFAGCTDLRIVRIASVSIIEKEAFRGDTAIKDELDVRGCQIMGEGVFKGCTAMTDILLGAYLQTIGKEAFASCSALETMMLPEYVLFLGDGCFRDCVLLRTINIPKGVTEIPSACFAGCKSLEKVYFYGDYPSAMARDCFSGANSNLTIYYRAGNQTWGAADGQWNGIPVVGLDKFYTEQEDHYSFANSRSSFGYGSKYFIPRQRFVTALQSIVRGSYYYAWDKSWRGSCFGMAASTLEFYEGEQFDVKDFTPSAENLYSVFAPRDSGAALTKIIEIYQVSQYADYISLMGAVNKGKYRELIRKVEEFERSGGLSVDSTADPVVINLYRGKNVGHAVVPVSVEVDYMGNYVFQVYDGNYPEGFQTLILKSDFSGIDYHGYTRASFVEYSVIRDALEDADFTGNSLKKEDSVESTNVSVAVNRDNVKLVNGGGRDYSEIEGAYEQEMISDNAEGDFSGIRSFVLPQGEYTIRDDSEETDENKGEQEALTYYAVTEDLFSEIETSDVEAEFTVKSVKGVGHDTITLSSENAETESDIAIMDVLGITREISVTGSSVTLEVKNEKKMAITVSDDTTEVRVDGKELELTDQKAEVSFFAGKGENPMKVEDLSCELFYDDSSQLSGTAGACVTWSREAADDVDITARIKDEGGNVLAEYREKMPLKTGMQKVNMALDKVKAELSVLPEDMKVECEMILVDSAHNEVRISQLDICLKKLEQQNPPPEETVSPSPSANPGEMSSPSPSANPGSTVSPSPTGKPQGGTSVPGPGVQNPAVTQTPVATQEPEASQKPTATPDTTMAPEPSGTKQPIQTQEPGQTNQPTVINKSALPKKGKILAAGSLKYIVVKSSKKNGAVEVYGSKKKNVKKLMIPKKVKLKGYTFKVTGIRQNAFSNMRKLSEVKIGANVKKIGKKAFKNCKNLRFAVIPSKVKLIGSQAFAGCAKFNALLVKSNKIKSVGAGAFQGVSARMTVKAPKSRWRKYSKLFAAKGKMPQSARYITNPFKLKYKGKMY